MTATASDSDSRVLVFSQRELFSEKFTASQYEFEDLIVALDDAQLVCPPRVARKEVSALGRRALHGVQERARRDRHLPPAKYPSMRPTAVQGEHDLFFAVISGAHQLAYLHRLEGWRERSRHAVCFLTEVWSRAVPPDADYYRVLQQFDEVHLFTPAAGPALAAVGSPVPTFLPLGVDAVRAVPGPHPPARVLDVYSYGRTTRAVHLQLLELVDSRNLTYVYDHTWKAVVPYPAEHRAQLMNMVKRSRYVLASKINDSADRTTRTGGEESLTTRYFEGSAGGAVMLGSRPDTPEFDACFPWPDAVIDLPGDTADVSAVLDDLDAQPERLAAARAAGVRGALLQHDWSYRWEQVLSGAGLAPTDALRERQARLQELAEAVPA